MKELDTKQYRYAWGCQAGENYQIYTGVTNDPYLRYGTGYAWTRTEGSAWYKTVVKSISSSIVEEFFCEDMPEKPENFPYEDKVWESCQEQLQINALKVAKKQSDLESVQEVEVELLNSNRAVTNVVKSREKQSSNEIFHQWAVNQWSKESDVQLYKDGDCLALFYSNKIRRAATDWIENDVKTNNHLKQCLASRIKKLEAQMATL